MTDRLERERPEPADQPAQRKRARRTAWIVAAVAFAIFLFSILQMFWLQHGGTH